MCVCVRERERERERESEWICTWSSRTNSFDLFISLLTNPAFFLAKAHLGIFLASSRTGWAWLNKHSSPYSDRTWLSLKKGAQLGPVLYGQSYSRTPRLEGWERAVNTTSVHYHDAFPHTWAPLPNLTFIHKMNQQWKSWLHKNTRSKAL